MHAIEHSPAEKTARPAGRFSRAVKLLKPLLNTTKRGTSKMEWFDIIKYVIPVVAALLAAFFPSFYSKLRAVRKATEAVTVATEERDVALAAAASAQAELDLTQKMQDAVQAEEKALQTFDAFAKQNGTSLGAMKRDNVLNKLQAYALSKGYAFDAEKWGAAIDAFVAATKIVNAIKR